MSWLFSRALVEEFSAATSWGGAPSAPLSVMPTPHKFWRNDKTMDASQLSRFGLTCAVLTEDRGEALLTWFRADSLVRTYPQQGKAKASTAPVRGCGARWIESSARYCLDSSSWRTHRCLWDEALPWSSVTLPRWGMTRNGYVYRHPTAERPISATASGLWPTPLARDAKSGVFSEAGRAKRNEQARGKPLNETVGGQLNPTWVEWLMGWPIGWTDLKPLGMDRFREWQQQHLSKPPAFPAEYLGSINE